MADEQECRFFNMIDPHLPDYARARLLDESTERYRAVCKESEDSVSLSASDVEVLRECAMDVSELVRRRAVRLLCELAPVTWDDLEEWGLDPDEEVRGKVMFSMQLRYMSARQLCELDKERCVGLVAKAAEAYEDSGVSIALWSLAGESDEWFDITWRTAERLIDLEREKISNSLCCGYIEDVLVYKKLGPNDPHIKSWIEGDKRERKEVLLGVALWLGCEEGNLREITEALSHDPDVEISEYAKELLERVNGEPETPNQGKADC